MIKIGEYQILTITRQMTQGFYLEDEEGEEVLMPGAYITPDMEIGDEIKVFVYCDSEDRNIATTERPWLEIGGFAPLRVTDVNPVGAFADWGTSKGLFIPFSNQIVKLRPGQRIVVTMYLDELSDRLVGTTKLKAFLKHQADASLRMGQEVDLIVYAQTDLGYQVIVNQKFAGLVYHNEVIKPLKRGQQLKGYVKPIREDGKIDISISPIGHQSIEPNAQKILSKLDLRAGFLPFTDKSDPEDIREEFGISKKLFKKALGSLYKQKLVVLKEDGIYKEGMETWE